MPKTTPFETAIRLNELATATLVLTNHLPTLDPETIPAHVRQGIENSLERIHQEIHGYKARAAALNNQTAA